MREKGSYTVEAAWIITICILLVFLGIQVGFDIFWEALEYIQNTRMAEVDVVELFRTITFAKEVINVRR